MEFQVRTVLVPYKMFRHVLRGLFFFSILAVFGTTQQVLADGCTDLGGAVTAGECMLTSSVTKSGTFNVPQTLRLSGAGAITVPAADGGNNLRINVTGDFIMEAGTKISGDVTGANAGTGTGANVVIDATGNILLRGASLSPSLSGAKITSTQTAGSCSGGKGGNITLQAGGNISTENGSELRVDAICPAGEIIIQAGMDTFIDGVVSSKSEHAGTGAIRRPGGGPITITGGCHTTIDDNAFVSSRGKDPGADLVHIEGGCQVDIFGYVESTNGHGVPNSPANHCGTSANRPHTGLFEEPTGCIEIWSGGLLFIDRKSHKGELSTDPIQQGGRGSAWIDIFAVGDISISGSSSGAVSGCNIASPYAVHANQFCVTNASGGVITTKSTTGSVTTGGKAIQAAGSPNGGNGGQVTVEAKNDTQLNTVDLAAYGDFNPTGGLGSGGGIGARSFTGVLNWQNGVGDVRPDGSIDLKGCTIVSTAGSSFPAGTPTTQTGSCSGAPQLPSYVTLPQCGCLGILVTKTCASVTVSPDGTKFIVKFSGTVTNLDSFPLHDVTISDDPIAQFSQLPPSVLPGGATVSFAGSYEATTIPGGGFSDTITVTGTRPSGGVLGQARLVTGVGSSSQVLGQAQAICPLTAIEPKITVTKKCTNPKTPLGNPVKFNGEVCNTGDEQLINITVTDAPPAKSIALDNTVLAPNTCTNYQGEYETTQTGTQKDTVTAQGTGTLSGAMAMATASANCTVVQPKVSVEVNGNCPPGQGSSPIVEFSGQVCNTGDEGLKQVKLVINKPQANTQLSFPSTLAKGQCASFSHTYTTTTSVDSATVTVTGVGTSSGLSVSAQDDADFLCLPPEAQEPNLTVTTACAFPATPLGSPISYIGEICNTGDETITKLTLKSNQPKAGTPIKLTKTTLAQNQCVSYKGTYPQSTKNGLITYTVTASARSLVGNLTGQASASATCALGQSCVPANWISLGLVNGWYKYKSAQRVGAVFSGTKTAGFSALANITLLQALSNKTFKTALETAAAQLIKEAVTALLNAAHPNVKYPITNTQTIINEVNAALTSKNLATIQALTQMYKSYNLLGGAPAICEAIPPC